MKLRDQTNESERCGEARPQHSRADYRPHLEASRRRARRFSRAASRTRKFFRPQSERSIKRSNQIGPGSAQLSDSPQQQDCGACRSRGEHRRATNGSDGRGLRALSKELAVTWREFDESRPVAAGAQPRARDLELPPLVECTEEPPPPDRSYRITLSKRTGF